MIEFSIPGFDSQHRVNVALLDLIKQEPEKFYNDIKITSCYDSWDCNWNGGRVKAGNVFKENVINALNFYNEHGIELRYTFTNSLIDMYPELLNDFLCNAILDITKDYQKLKTRININSEQLKSYIEGKYPNNFEFMWSTTKDIKDINTINQLNKNELIVPSYNINNDFDILKQFIYPNNIELLCCEPCIDNCPHRKEHHESVSKNQLLESIESSFICPFNCENYSYYEAVGKRKHNISITNIREKYLPLGINKFKISGRRDSQINLVENYVNYFVKPEYINDIRNKLLNAIW